MTATHQKIANVNTFLAIARMLIAPDTGVGAAEWSKTDLLKINAV